MVHMAVGKQHRHHRFFRPVGKIERQSLFGRFGAQQGVDDRNPGFAFDNGHIGKIEITDLVNAVGNFEQAADIEQL